MRRKLAAWGAAVAIVGVPACGAAGHTQPSELTDAELARLDRAEELLVQRCMVNQGLKYWPGPSPSADELKSVGLVLDDIGWAARHGYGGELQRKAEQQRKRDPNTAYNNKLPASERARWDRALFGDQDRAADVLSVKLPAGGRVETSRTGCLAKAQQQLYGDQKKWFHTSKIAESIPSLYEKDMAADDRLTAAVRKWSRCMRERGHTYSSPSRLHDQVSGITAKLSPTRAHATEVRLATVEAKCAQSTSLGKTVRSLEDKYQEKAIGKKYRKVVDTHLRLQHEALARAQRITADRD